MALVGEGNARTAVALGNTVIARWNLGDTRGLLEDQVRVISILERTLGPTHSDTSWARRIFAERLLELGRLDEALAHASVALHDSETAFGETHPVVASSALIQARILRELGRVEEALALDDRAVAIATAHPQSGLRRPALVDRAATLRRAGACGEAVAIADAVLAEAEPLADEVVTAHLERARCALAGGEADLAALDLGLALVAGRARGDGVFSILPLQRELARALAQRSPAAARPVATEALDVVRRTGVRPSWRAELERLAAE